MSRRIVVGKRGNGDYGIFVSKAGFDALVALDNELIMNISDKVSSLIMLGNVPETVTIPLGFSQPPVVLATAQYSLAWLENFVGTGGPARPSPFLDFGGSVTATINDNGASVTITSNGKAVYAVYSKAFG